MSTADALENLGGARVTRQAGKRVFQILIDVALPPVCAGCGLGGAWLCPRCAESEHLIDVRSACGRCGRPLGVAAVGCERCAGWDASLDRVRSAYPFEGAVRSMIHLLKYNGQWARAAWCARAIVESGVISRGSVDLVVPVPLHRQKERQRGYNQSRHIATRLAAALDLDMADALVRIRQTRSQVDLDAEQRRVNVQGAFVARRQLEGVNVLLIDDVVTTGSTLVECAVACRGAGAASVSAATVASALAAVNVR